uniref:Uncharacterized protein n=1 Tax=mine drainage metagenome TaxID=410659 RepID=E6PD45_9ZZZZ
MQAYSDGCFNLQMGYYIFSQPSNMKKQREWAYRRVLLLLRTTGSEAASRCELRLPQRYRL